MLFRSSISEEIRQRRLTVISALTTICAASKVASEMAIMTDNIGGIIGVQWTSFLGLHRKHKGTLAGRVQLLLCALVLCVGCIPNTSSGMTEGTRLCTVTCRRSHLTCLSTRDGGVCGGVNAAGTVVHYDGEVR